MNDCFDSMEDKILVAAAQQGSEEAFSELYRRNRIAIARLAYRYVGNYHDAEELLQEIFMKGFLGIKKYQARDNASFFSWIYRIGINCAINFIKSRRRDIPRTLFDTHEKDTPAPDIFDPEKNMQHSDQEKELYKRLENLSPGQRMIFILKHFQELNISEIAEYMNCSEGSIRKQLYRAYTKLRKELSPI